MENLSLDLLKSIFFISIIFSSFEMVLVQKVKTLTFFKKEWHVILFNFISSFVMGTLFSMWFFKTDLFSGLWVSLFSFIGAPSIYELLKKQNIINYTTKSLSDFTSSSDDSSES